jgi:hypothetical protein
MHRKRGSRWIAVLAVRAGILALAAAVASGPAAAQGSGHRRETPPAASKLQPRPPAPEAAAPARSAEDAAREARERQERALLDQRLSEQAAALGEHALGLTYGAAALIVLTLSLWVLAILQARDLRAAVRAVEESSSAARRSAEFMQRALVLTQRATVIVGEPRAVWLRDAADRLVGCRLLVTWHNVGGTPTRDMVAAVAGLATEKPPSQTSALPRTDVRRQPLIVGPNAAVSSAYVNLPVGLVADVLQHRAYYLFAGWAEYNDVFEGTPRHRVEFCYWVEFEGKPEAGRLEARFHLHGRHNRHCDVEDGADGGVRPFGSDTVAQPPKKQYGVGAEAMPSDRPGLTAQDTQI